LTSVLKAFRENRSNEIDSQALIRDFTNRCLVQHSIKFVTSEERSFFSSSGWYIEEDGSHDSFSMTLLGVDASEGNSSPSAHIQMVFKAYPNLAMLRDECGRLPLHWASSSGDASYDTYDTVSFILKKNPAAASARDPISGLFPFMLAASVSNEAAFELLLASPNLVASGVKSASDDGLAFKKRKMVPT
jgi:ankyrin repeat protein